VQYDSHVTCQEEDDEQRVEYREDVRVLVIDVQIDVPPVVPTHVTLTPDHLVRE
jgi:hypothetical protein